MTPDGNTGVLEIQIENSRFVVEGADHWWLYELIDLYEVVGVTFNGLSMSSEKQASITWAPIRPITMFQSAMQKKVSA